MFADDLKVGELYIALPIALAVLIFVFGTAAFLIPMLFALVAIPTSLAYSDRVGPLSGKTLWAVFAFLVSWAGLHAYMRRRDVDLSKVWLITVVLLGLALLGTFSPFFELFAPEE